MEVADVKEENMFYDYFFPTTKYDCVVGLWDSAEVYMSVFCLTVLLLNIANHGHSLNSLRPPTKSDCITGERVYFLGH